MIQVELVCFVKTYKFIITATNLILSLLAFAGFKTQKTQLNSLQFAV